MEVSKPSPGVVQRIVTIEGAVAMLKLATGRITEKLLEAHNVPARSAADAARVPVSEVSLTLLVANSVIGGVIGKGGVTIKAIRESSGATIKVRRA